MAQFYKFPRTPHLVWSAVVDDDRSISRAEFDKISRKCEIVIQEEIDGINVGIHSEQEWQLVPVLMRLRRIYRSLCYMALKTRIMAAIIY
jgi:hypothetical protein